MQVNSDEVPSESTGEAIGTSEDWVVVDSGKSFAWSAKQHGTLQQQFDAIEKLVQHQSQQVQISQTLSLTVSAHWYQSSHKMQGLCHQLSGLLRQKSSSAEVCC